MMKYAPLLFLIACAELPAKVCTVTVENQLPFVLEKVIVTTGEVDNVATGATTDPMQVTPAFDYGYALAGKQVLRITHKLSMEDGGTYQVIFDADFRGACNGMSQAEYEDIAIRVFPDAEITPFDDISC